MNENNNNLNERLIYNNKIKAKVIKIKAKMIKIRISK
jgi:hypothetical protein